MQLKDLQAYEILEKRPIKDLNSEGIILRHKKSGARIAVISNDDDNKVFYIGFRTPPEDSTGVALFCVVLTNIRSKILLWNW